MNKQQALRYLLEQHRPPTRISTKYGPTDLSRALVTWEAAIKLSPKLSEITPELLEEIIKSVEKGENVVESFLEFTEA